MDYDVFKESIVRSLQQKFPNAEIKSNRVKKNNGMVLDSLIIDERESIIAPCIYLNSYYVQSQQGVSIENIIKEIKSKYKAAKENKGFLEKHTLIDSFSDFTRASECVIYKLVNFEKNKELLEEVPFTRFLDLAIVYMFLAKEEQDSVGTILIRNEHLQMWNISLEEVHLKAMYNTPKLMRAKIDSMDDVLSNLFGGFMQGNTNKKSCMSGLYVVSNVKGIQGAATILYPDLLNDFAHSFGEITRKIYILPSSIHESILIPYVSGYDVKQLQQMVTEVNRSQVLEEEILSDSVYVYDTDENRIYLAMEGTN